MHTFVTLWFRSLYHKQHKSRHNLFINWYTSLKTLMLVEKLFLYRKIQLTMFFIRSNTFAPSLNLTRESCFIYFITANFATSASWNCCPQDRYISKDTWVARIRKIWIAFIILLGLFLLTTSLSVLSASMYRSRFTVRPNQEDWRPIFVFLVFSLTLKRVCKNVTTISVLPDPQELRGYLS